MSKNSTAAWNRYTTEESAVLGYQFSSYSSPSGCLLQCQPIFTSILRNLLLSDIIESIYSQKKLPKALTENEHGKEKNSRYNNDSFTKETLH